MVSFLDFVRLNPFFLFCSIIFCLCFYLLYDYILDWGYFLIVDQRSNTRGYRQDRRNNKLIQRSNAHVVFYRTYWKRPQYLQEIHSKCFIKVDNPDKGIFDLGPTPSQLYIRPCYKDLYNYLLSQSDQRGTLVTGSPGIGKSCFLVYALVRRLMEGKTTILSNSVDTILFDDRGVWKLDRTPLQSDLQLEEGDDFVWCLYNGVDLPVPAFFSVHCFLVHVTSPQLARYKEWTKQVGAKTWYMDVWMKAEFHESMRLRGEECDDGELENCMSTYGPCSRDHTSGAYSEGKHESSNP
ncbi:hypothetical protein VKT23_016906 [Stygiomarasmius scandens]|uniref:Uncharacterized protein n=1 Tax=Marasmiellus scandens TaxID=2682957 RepID=A0ABR1IVC4_9AGAR